MRPTERGGKKTGRNDPCPCGSGKKHKRCCLAGGGAGPPFAEDERVSALGKLRSFVEVELGPEDDQAYDQFYAPWHEDERFDGLDAEWMELSDAVYDMWFFFDWQLDDGRSPVELFLDEDPPLSAGERRYLELGRETAMRLYEVDDLAPGMSVTLRDVAAGTRLLVHERLGSRSLARHDLIAARIIGSGASGHPEIEAGLVQIPGLAREPVVTQLAAHRERHRREHPGAGEAGFDKEMAPFFHQAWMSCLIDPPIPRLKNTDGEDVLITRVRFDVADPAGLEARLDGGTALEREEEGKTAWLWSGKNPRGEPILLGRIAWAGASMELECNSARRGEHGRALIEGLAGSGVRHLSTSHENIAMAVRDRLRSGEGAGEGEPPSGLSREQQETLTLEALARHYRGWLDEKIPALSDRTPREAARDAALRPKLSGLIEDLEGSYHAALKRGEPAYDPSWMWDELELRARARVAHPPPLAHERLASMVPGLGELCREVAGRVRRRPGFDDASTILTAEEIRSNLEVGRFLRELQASGGDPGDAAAGLEAHIQCMVNFELHRRKTFWVDESLAYMLAKTDLDLTGRELRVPFPCFALVFADRYVLSLAERMLSGDRLCPQAGHFLRVATVFVTEERVAEDRLLRIGLALDALGADPPHLVMHDVPLAEDAQIERHLEGLAPPVVTDPASADWNPLRGLLHVVLNAILYATSAGVEAKLQQGPETARGAGAAPGALAYSSEAVYFLPGSIAISRLRRMQELERIPSGRELLHRFMVRGHWRRPPESWKDQRMRWIEPYWKGPDLAAVIERTYKLVP